MLEDRNNIIIDSSQVGHKITFSLVRWVPVPAVRFSPGQGHYVVFLGKVCMFYPWGLALFLVIKDSGIEISLSLRTQTYFRLLLVTKRTVSQARYKLRLLCHF